MLAGIGSLLSGIGGLFGLGVGVANSVSQSRQADSNLALQQEAFNWNKDFQERNFNYQKYLNDRSRSDSLSLIEQTMAREDNAIQRRAADLEAAGFSRHLAAGTGASASSFSMPAQSTSGGSGLSAPQRAFTQLQLSNTVINDMVGVLEGVERVAKSREERLLLQNQRQLVTSQIAERQANTGYLDSQTKYTKAKADREEFVRDYEKRLSSPLDMLKSNVSGQVGPFEYSGPYGVAADLVSSVEQYMEDSKDLVNELNDESFRDRAASVFSRGLGFLNLFGKKKSKALSKVR